MRCDCRPLLVREEGPSPAHFLLLAPRLGWRRGRGGRGGALESEGTWSPSCLDLRPTGRPNCCVNAPLNRCVVPQSSTQVESAVAPRSGESSAPDSTLRSLSPAVAALNMLWLAGNTNSGGGKKAGVRGDVGHSHSVTRACLYFTVWPPLGGKVIPGSVRFGGCFLIK